MEGQTKYNPLADLQNVIQNRKQILDMFGMGGKGTPSISGLKAPSQIMNLYGDAISTAAGKHDLDPNILARLIWKESRGNPKAISPKGARGIGQFMPGTRKMMEGMGYDFSSNEGEINAIAGYLDYIRRNFGATDYPSMLAGYNAGPGRLKGAQWTKIPETVDYVNWITGGQYG